MAMIFNKEQCMKLTSFGLNNSALSQNCLPTPQTGESIKTIAPTLVATTTLYSCLNDKLDLNNTVKKTLDQTPQFLKEVSIKNKAILMRGLYGLGAAFGVYSFIDYCLLKEEKRKNLKNQEQLKSNNS